MSAQNLCLLRALAVLPIGERFVYETVRQTAVFGFWTKRFISQRRQRRLPADSLQLATFSLPPFVAVLRLGHVVPRRIAFGMCIGGLLSVAPSRWACSHCTRWPTTAGESECGCREHAHASCAHR